jgi:hypothetical protein
VAAVVAAFVSDRVLNRVPMALRAAEGDEDALARRSARAHACRVGIPADMFSERVFKGAAADSYPIHWTPESLRGRRSPVTRD